MCVRGINLKMNESERPCMCVRGINFKMNESERPCMCVKGIFRRFFIRILELYLQCVFFLFFFIILLSCRLNTIEFPVYFRFS